MDIPSKKLPVLKVGEQVKLPIFYLLLAGSFSGWQSLYNVHLDALGYSSLQIGVLNAIFISVSALVVPFWGVLADKFGNKRVFLLLTAVAGVLVFLVGQTMAFQWMAFFIFLISVFHQPGGAILDGMTMSFVRRKPSYSFGQFRLWNSAGYGLAALIVGYFARHNTGIIFHVSAALFLLLSVFNLLTLPSRPQSGGNRVNFKSLSHFFFNRRLLSFLLIILILVWGVNIKDIWISVAGILAMIAVAFFAVWSLIGNILAGVIIYFTTPFKINDNIEILHFKQMFGL